MGTPYGLKVSEGHYTYWICATHGTSATSPRAHYGGGACQWRSKLRRKFRVSLRDN